MLPIFNNVFTDFMSTDIPYQPIITGVPWIWKCWASSLPLVASSLPSLTKAMRDVTCKIFKNKNDSYLKESRYYLIKIFNDRCNIYHSRTHSSCSYTSILAIKIPLEQKEIKIVICNQMMKGITSVILIPRRRPGCE